MKAITHLLNYVAMHPEPMICFKRSDMQLEIATDSSYLSETKSRSRNGGYHYLSNLRPARPILPEDPLPMMNGPVHVHCSIMPMIVSSAAEAETGGLLAQPTTPQRANKKPYLQGTGAPRHYPHTLINLLFEIQKRPNLERMSNNAHCAVLLLLLLLIL
jgi:hypothetical protein